MQRRGQGKIVFTKHAERRLIDREITKTQVRTVLMNPVQIIRDETNTGFKCFGTPENIPYSDEPFLVVIYEQDNTEIKVITIMWQDMAGLRANGFR